MPPAAAAKGDLDAMMALQPARNDAADPIAALGLDSTAKPVAVRITAAAAPTKPVLVQGQAALTAMQAGAPPQQTATPTQIQQPATGRQYRATRSASTSRAPICARSCARSLKSAA